MHGVRKVEQHALIHRCQADLAIAVPQKRCPLGLDVESAGLVAKAFSDVQVGIRPGHEIGVLEPLDSIGLKVGSHLQLQLMRLLVGRLRPVLDVGAVLAREEAIDAG